MRAAQRPPRHALVGDPLAADVLAGHALDGGLGEAVGEAEVLALLAQQRRRLHVRELEPAALGAQLALPAPRLVLERRGALGVHDDQDLEVAQLVLPRPGVVAQALGARRHAVADLLREAVEDPGRELQRRERAERQRDVERRGRVRRPTPPRS